MIGLRNPSQDPATVADARSYSARASGVVRCAPNSEMSAPDMNALVPAPVITTTRTAGSPSSAAMAPGSAERMARESGCACRGC